ncbi:hypothetical protein BsIDN1_28280 [Bacillus safensis]|uniref:precorrin-2 dehydrogenase n=1 Tax=Bacillus safensis TaxID=561879 RepID=A0A5S9M6J2_BACIA|nr:hypothetical protein BsIDN1_28280 [Bacillus safensis]
MLPVHLDLTDKQVVIAGGGSVALRRAKALCTESCQITVVSPDLSEEMACLIDTYALNWKEKKVGAEDLKDAFFFIVAATNDPSVNEWIANKQHSLTSS